MKMRRSLKSIFITAAVAVLVPSVGCSDRDRASGKGAKPAAATQPMTNRIDVPAQVRENLGITFVKVEKRQVASTLRVPGRFELLPSARREYHTAMPGRIEVLVTELQGIEPGTPLFRIDSPEWRRTKLELEEVQLEIKTAKANLQIAKATKAEADATVDLLQKRSEALAGLDVKRSDLELEVARALNARPKFTAEVEAKQAALEEAEAHYPMLVAAAAAVTGMSESQLVELVTHEGKQVPRWRAINLIEVTARNKGVVDSIAVTNGAWAETSARVLSTSDPDALRFRASGFQSDLPNLRDGLTVRIAPPQSSSYDPNEAITGVLQLGLSADPAKRTIELFAKPEGKAVWARAGVAAYLEIATKQSSAGDMAIPLAAVVKDQLQHVIFRRDPRDPDKVIRMEADLGPNDGRWVVLRSGVKAGDEVVLSGAYDLNLLGGGKRAEGGHFHPDGTFHAGND